MHLIDDRGIDPQPQRHRREPTPRPPTAHRRAGSARGSVAPPEVPLAILKRLGPPPFWDGKTDVMDILAKVYDLASKEALRLAYDGDESNAEK